MLDFVIYDREVERGNELAAALQPTEEFNIRAIKAVTDAQSVLDHARTSHSDTVYIIEVENEKDSLGLSLLGKVWELRSGYCTICLTGASSLALPALKAHAFDLFIRPYSFSALLESIQALETFQKKRPLDAPLNIYGASKTIFLKQSEIRYFASRGSDITAYSVSSEHTWRCSFLELTAKLHTSGFIRVSRNYIVNTRYIQEIDWAEDLVTMDDGTVLPVSRRNRKPLRDLLTL